MELVDQVNESDEIIGKIDRDTAHRDSLLHRAVAIYIFDEQGRLFIQPHLKSNGRFDHSVGGHVSLGESYDAAAKREAKEEANLSEELTFIFRFFIQRAKKSSCICII